MGGKMISQNNLGRNMMGQDINNIMSNRGMTSGMSNMMGHGRTMEVMGHNLMGQDRTSQIMSGNIMGHQDMTPNLMYINRMGHNYQQPNVLQSYEHQQWTHGPTYDAANGDEACS